jgi:sigma-B regulation protein RsbQ
VWCRPSRTSSASSCSTTSAPAGRTPAAWRPQRYQGLAAYARDVLDLIEELDLEDVVFVGHSVSAMIGVLAANRAPERFGALVLVSPSPRYIDDENYAGGFTHADIEGLLATMDESYLGWSAAMAPVIMGNATGPSSAASSRRASAAPTRTSPGSSPA